MTRPRFPDPDAHGTASPAPADNVLPHEVRFGRPTSASRNFLERASRPILYLGLLYFLLAAFAFLAGGVMFFVELQRGNPQPEVPLEPYLPAMTAAAVVAGISSVTADRINRGRRMWLVVNDRGVTVGYWSRPQSWNITWPEVAHVSVFHISSKNSLTGKHVLVVKPRRSTPWFSTKTPTDPVSYQFLFHDVALHRHFWDRGYLAVLHLDNVDAHPEVLREAVETFGGPDRYRTEAELCAQDPGLKP